MSLNGLKLCKFVSPISFWSRSGCWPCLGFYIRSHFSGVYLVCSVLDKSGAWMLLPCSIKNAVAHMSKKTKVGDNVCLRAVVCWVCARCWEGVRLPKTLQGPLGPRLPQISQNWSWSFLTTSQEFLWLSISKSNPEVPSKFPRLPQKFHGPLQKQLACTIDWSLSLGNLMPSDDLPKIWKRQSVHKIFVNDFGAPLPPSHAAKWWISSWVCIERTSNKVANTQPKLRTNSPKLSQYCEQTESWTNGHFLFNGRHLKLNFSVTTSQKRFHENTSLSGIFAAPKV